MNETGGKKDSVLLLITHQYSQIFQNTPFGIQGSVGVYRASNTITGKQI